MQSSWPKFPVARADRLQVPPDLQARGYGLRPAVEGDLPFLRTLYGQTRAEELAPVPWPPTTKQAFLDSQFDLQHRHYLGFFGAADFLVIEKMHEPVGRLYLLRDAENFRIIDISLFDTAQRNGVASSLIAYVQERASTALCGVALHVDHRNPGARRLYERLGFVATDDEGQTHLPMRWTQPQFS